MCGVTAAAELGNASFKFNKNWIHTSHAPRLGAALDAFRGFITMNLHNKDVT